MTHYATLGVAENASPDDIKKAFRSLASKHHPDKGGDTARFQEIQAAYAVIGDEQKRAQYDAERRGGGFRFTVNGRPFENGGVPPGMEDLFAQFGFGRGDPFGGSRHQPSRRNKDLQVRIGIPLVETLTDQTKTISVQTTNGERITVEVQVPRGVNTGVTVKYPELGDNLFTSLQRGDLYVQFEVQPSPNFEVAGLDLITPLTLNSVEAMIGCEKTVRCLDGTELTITIPAGTQPMSKFRIYNQGLWQMHQNTRGNLLVNVHIVTPALSAEAQQKAQELLTLINSTN
jgi:molecular chaperone DnaJ/curved DNA-binding protein